jgi:predicted patatin/cPLA2 family phospholipase
MDLSFVDETSHVAPSTDKVDTLILEGGAVPGISYIGVVRELENRGIMRQIQYFGGTSVGALMCAFLSCRASGSFIEQCFYELSLPSLLDWSFNPFRCAWRLLVHHGLCAGDKMRDFVGKKLQILTGSADITFREVLVRFQTTLVMVATNLDTQRPMYFSPMTTPDVPLREGVRCSASIPFVFTSVDHHGMTLVDGGLTENMPYRPFFNSTILNDPALIRTLDNVICVKMYTDLYQKPLFSRVRFWPSFIVAIIETLYNHAMDYTFHSGNSMDLRTIFIPAGNVRLIDFWLSTLEKQQLIEAGRGATAKFLEGRQTPIFAMKECVT